MMGASIFTPQAIFICEAKMAINEPTKADAEPADTDQRGVTGTRRRNMILGVILGCAALAMYLSIFLRLSESPLQ